MCKHIIVEMHYIYEFKKVSNSKSDLQTHEGHYQSMSFDVPYNFLLVFHCNYVYLASFPRYGSLFIKI